MKNGNSNGGSTAVMERRVSSSQASASRGGSGDVLLTQAEARQLLGALVALKQGDSSVRLPLDWAGLQGKLAEAFNDVVDLNGRVADELARLRQKVGKEGKLKQRASLGDVRGFWRYQINSVN